MVKKTSYRMAKALMAGSLILLLCLTGMWLWKVWIEKKTQIQREANHLLMSAVRDLSDSLIQQRLGAATISVTDSGSGRHILIGSMLDSGAIQKPSVSIQVNRFRSDSGPRRRMVFSEERGALLAGRNRGAPQADFPPHVFPGALSLFASERKDASVSVIQLEDPVGQRINRLIAGFDLPPRYQLLAITDTSWREPMGGIRSIYLDMPTQQRLMLSVADYEAHALRKMVPETLFSLLLLGVVCLAFGFTAQTMRNQIQLNAQKDHFIHNMTHELKTPVSTMRVVLEALENYRVMESPDKAREYIRIALSEADRLSALTERVLNLSLLEQGRLQFDLQRLNLSVPLRQAIAVIQPLIEIKAGVLSLSFPEAPAWTHADPLHLLGAFHNVLDNAIKYSEGPPQIEVVLAAARGGWVVSVCDRGIGIDPELQDRVFEKFFRAPDGNRHLVKGYGLGLSYVAEVMEAFEGRAKAVSREGGGTCMELFFQMA